MDDRKIIQFPNSFCRETKLQIMNYYRSLGYDKNFLKIVQKRVDDFFELPFFTRQDPLNIDTLPPEEVDKLRNMIDEAAISFAILLEETLKLEEENFKLKKKWFLYCQI